MCEVTGRSVCEMTGRPVREVTGGPMSEAIGRSMCEVIGRFMSEVIGRTAVVVPVIEAVGGYDSGRSSPSLGADRSWSHPG